MFCVPQTIVRPIKSVDGDTDGHGRKELEVEAYSALPSHGGLASTEWNLSDLLGVLTFIYRFRQNWNAKQILNHSAVNGNCQVYSQLKVMKDLKKIGIKETKWSHSLTHKHLL